MLVQTKMKPLTIQRKPCKYLRVNSIERRTESSTKNLRSKLVETKERQKLRNKPNGVNIIGLALGKKVTIEQELSNVRFDEVD